MIYKRRIYERLIKEIHTKQMVVVTGMRRVGKTTLLKQIYEEIGSENKAYLDLEDPVQRKVFETGNYEAVWNSLAQYRVSPVPRPYIFVDEIQNVKQFPSVAKYLYDHYDVKFFVTGSSSYYLKNLFSESLAGRKLIFELYPLDFEEFLIFKEVKKPFYRSILMTTKYKNKIQH